MLGGPARLLAAVALSIGLTHGAHAELVDRGVGTGVVSLTPVVLSMQTEEPVCTDEYGLSVETTTQESGGSAHLRINHDRPYRFALTFDVQIGATPTYQESNMPNALFDSGESAEGMLLRVDARAHGLSRSLSIEIHNHDGSNSLQIDLENSESLFELHLDEGTYSIIVRGTNEPAELAGDRDIKGVPAPASLMLAALAGAGLRRRRP